MSRSVALKRLVFYAIAATAALSSSGCVKLKGLFTKPRAGEVVQESHPFTVYTYRASAVVNAAEEDIVDYFLKDLTWLENASSMLEVDLPPQEEEKDYTRVGETVDFKIRISGITFPVRATVIKYTPNREVWLMIVTWGSWLLWRIDLEPMEEGCMMNMYLFGVWSKNLERIISTFKLTEAGAVKFDLILSIAQARFNPDVDSAELTEKGLRGKVYDAFHQGHESSIRVDAPPQKVVDWILSNPENLQELIPVLTLDEACVERTRSAGYPDRVVFCPCGYRVGARDTDSQMVSGGAWMGRIRPSYSHVFLITALDSLVRIEVMVERKGLGSELNVIIYSELPGPHNPEAMDIMIGVAEIPGIMARVLPEVKRSIEAGGILSASNEGMISVDDER